MLNKSVIMGRLTRDPELRHAGEVPVCSFTIACDRDYKNANGEKETDFIDVVAWRTTAEYVKKFFPKGRMAIVEGRIQVRNWTDKDKSKRRNTEIVADNVYFGGSKPSADGDGQQGSAPPADFVPDFNDPTWPA